MSQRSNVDWIEFNKREEFHKRLLVSMSRGQRDRTPCAFYNPNMEPVLLRSSSQKSNTSRKSHRNTPKKTKIIESLNFEPKHSRRPSRDAQKMKHITNQILESRREKLTQREDRVESERKGKISERKKVGVPRIPERALKSTYIIKDEENRVASAESQYADPGTVSQRMLSQTATQPWQVDSSNNNDLDPEILVTSCILKDTQTRPKTNDKVAKPNKLLPMLNLDESVQKMPSKG